MPLTALISRSAIPNTTAAREMISRFPQRSISLPKNSNAAALVSVPAAYAVEKSERDHPSSSSIGSTKVETP